MPTNILMPALSPTMEKGNLAKWLKKEGDAIKSGDVIAEIETDKATMEVEAVDEGILAKIVVPEGMADVPVNQVIAVIAGEGEDAKSIAAPAAGASAEGRGAARKRLPAARSAGSGRASRRSGRAPAAASAAGLNPGGRVFASPLATPPRQGCRARPRRRSRAPARMAASSRRDIEAANHRRRRQGAPRRCACRCSGAQAGRRAARRRPVRRAVTKKLLRAGLLRGDPHDGMRKTIARRLTEAKSNHPAFLPDGGLSRSTRC